MLSLKLKKDLKIRKLKKVNEVEDQVKKMLADSDQKLILVARN